MQLSDQYELPNERIARYPAKSEAPVVTVLNREIGEVSHHIFRDLLIFKSGDL